MRDSARGAFTLLELLVVVAIIALLAAILIPALAGARQRAKTAVCLGYLRGAGLGLQAYQSEYPDYFPGPNTTGAEITRLTTAYVFRNERTEPTFNTDWMSPIVGQPLSLPDDRIARIYALNNHRLRCPNTDYRYDGAGPNPGVGIDDPTNMQIASYVAVFNFHVYRADEAPAGTLFQPADVQALVALPRGYRFRLSQVGSPAAKVFALDGTRFVNHTMNDQVQFHKPWSQVRGGNYMDFGPALSDINGSPYRAVAGVPTAATLKFGFRHQGKLNALFFDGHAETQDQAAARDVRQYFPTGATVVQAAQTSDVNDADGMTIP